MDEGDYARTRWSGVMALVLTPAMIAITVGWVVVHPDYPAGDWRGDLAARAIFGAVAIAFICGVGVTAVVKWRRMDERRNRSQ